MNDRQLPPGDRNDAPIPPPAPAEQLAATRPLPGIDLVLDALRRSLDDAQASFAAVALARRHDTLPALESLAHRHLVLAKNLATTITAARARRP